MNNQTNIDLRRVIQEEMQKFLAEHREEIIDRAEKRVREMVQERQEQQEAAE